MMERGMADLRLSFACGPYDRTQALRDGSIKPDGIELTYVTLQPAEIFWRMLQYQEFDASEMSLSNYTTLVGSGTVAVHRHPGVPVTGFPPRLFLHQHAKGHFQSGRPQRQARRRAGIQHDGRGLYARACCSMNTASSRATSNGCRAAPTGSVTNCRADIRLTQAPAGAELGDLLERGEIDF